jgi:hypothetical protein
MRLRTSWSGAGNSLGILDPGRGAGAASSVNVAAGAGVERERAPATDPTRILSAKIEYRSV